MDNLSTKQRVGKLESDQELIKEKVYELWNNARKVKASVEEIESSIDEIDAEVKQTNESISLHKKTDLPYARCFRLSELMQVLLTVLAGSCLGVIVGFLLSQYFK